MTEPAFSAFDHINCVGERTDRAHSVVITNMHAIPVSIIACVGNGQHRHNGITGSTCILCAWPQALSWVCGGIGYVQIAQHEHALRALKHTALRDCGCKQNRLFVPYLHCAASFKYKSFKTIIKHNTQFSRAANRVQMHNLLSTS